MDHPFATTLLLALAAYLAVGVVFGIVFAVAGVGRIDHSARGAPWSFRVLIVPGAAVLWPILAFAWRRAGREDPPQ